MRKLLVGLIAVAFLAVAAPVQAQLADPLGLIASGAVIPYVGSTGIAVVNSATGAITDTVRNTGSLAILEISSPVGSNAPPEESVFGSDPLHMFFFNQACVRQGPSVGNPLTTNDADLVNLNLIGMGDNPNQIPGAGLIALAAVAPSGDVLVPLNNPIHARVYWINAVDGVLSRVLEPISALHGEIPIPIQPFLWNPLRSGATFVAPLEGSGVSTTLYLACPTTNIIPGVFPDANEPPFGATTTATVSPLSTTIPVEAGDTAAFAPSGTAFICTLPGFCQDAFTYTGITNTSFTGVSGVGGVYGEGTPISPIALGGPTFPHLSPTPVPGTAATPLFLRIYDDEENFIRDVGMFCRCWGAHPVAEIDPVYANPNAAPRGTYTEMQGQPACVGDSFEDSFDDHCSFTGYRAINWGAGVVGNDVFGRLSNASHLSLQGLPPINVPGFGIPIR